VKSAEEASFRPVGDVKIEVIPMQPTSLTQETETSETKPSEPKTPTQTEEKLLENMPDLIEVPKLTKEQIAAAKTMGFPLDKLFSGLEALNLFAKVTEVRFMRIDENFKKVNEGLEKTFSELGLKLQPVIELSQKIAQAQANPQAAPPPQGQGTLSTIMQILPAILGSSNPAPNPFQAKLMDLTFENLGLGNALVKAIIMKTLPDVGAELIAKSVPKAEIPK